MRATNTPTLLLFSGLTALAVLTTSGCADEGNGAPYVPSELGAAIEDTRLSDLVPTVVHVDWSVSGAVGEVSTWIEYGADDDYGFEVVGERAAYGAYGAWLVGVGPLTDLHFRAVVTDAEGTAHTEDHVVTTGDVHPDLPALELIGAQDELVDGGLIATSIVNDPPAAVVLNARGEYVWWLIAGDTERAGVSASELSHDGESVLFIDFDTQAGGDDETKDCRFVRADLEGEEQVSFPVELGHHDFTELPDGSLAFLVFDERVPDDYDLPITGDLILETSADGAQSRVVWSSWDTLPWQLNTEDPSEWDWTHANSIVYDEPTDAYYVGLRTLGSIVVVDRSSGEMLEVIGGDASDYATADGSTEFFRHQHRYQLLEDGIVVFDNREDEPAGSRAVELTLDRASGLAEEVWSHRPDPPLISHSLGDVGRLPSGLTLVTWSTEGQIHAVDADGELAWGVSVEDPAGFGYARWYPDEGR